MAHAMRGGAGMPMAWHPDIWDGEQLQPWLRLCTWTSLLMEPMFGLMVWLPLHHPLKSAAPLLVLPYTIAT